MYFLKNSRCVLRKSQWFSSNVFERNFRISLGKSRVKWPEDDPTKPPLRLNIPKDTPVPGPYNFTPQVQLNSNQANINTEKLVTNWLTPDIKFGNSEADEMLKKPKYTTTVEENGNPSEIPDNLNFSVRSKSSESLNSKWNTDEDKNHLNSETKNLKLKKVRSYEGLLQKMGVGGFSNFESKGENGIRTIKIALNNHENENVVAGTSQEESKVDVMSDEHVRALAEAIVNELSPNMANTDEMQAKSAEKEDEAFLVIVNLTDKDLPEDAVMQLSADPSASNRKAMNAESLNKTFYDGCYGTRIKVRDLDVSDEVEKNAYKKKLEGGVNPRESDMPMVGSKRVSRSAESAVVNSITFDAEFDRQVREQSQHNRNMNFTTENRSLKSAEYLSKEKDRRKEVFESTIRRIRATRSQIPIGKRMQTIDLPKKKLSTVSTGASSDEFIRSRLPRPIEYVSEFRMRNRIMQGSHLEEIGEQDDFTPKAAESPDVTLIDDLPELILRPECKMLRKGRGEIKNIEDDKFKKSSTIRSYHNSCKNLCKLTNGIGEEKPPIVVMNLNKKSGNSSKGDGNSPREGNVKTDPLRLTKEYSKSKLDNTCDVLSKSSKLPDLNGSNDIYLQEESVINNKLQRTEEKTVHKTDKMQHSKKEEDDLGEERYELDIADARTSPKYAGVKVPYSAAYPSNPALARDERTRFEIFRDIESETFEMNEKCLNNDETPESKMPDGTIPAHAGCKTPEIMTMKTVTTTTPKISDNIANLANEVLTEQKGQSSIDSLSLMKRVKEMVDMDLKNAEKIFVAGELDELNVEQEMEKKTTETLPSSVGPSLPKSVVIHNEETNQYYVSGNELEHAINFRKREISLILEKLNILELNREAFTGDIPLYVNMTQDPTEVNANYVLKKGDSILVYDEEKRRWDVDFGLLKEKEQTNEQQNQDVLKDNISSPESSPEKCQTDSKEVPSPSRATISDVLPITEKTKLEKDVPDKPTESVRKTDSTRKGKNEPGKEVDAKEIRRKNSDLYDDVFVGIKNPAATAKKNEGEVADSSNRVKKADGAEKPPSEHYVSKNIVEMSKSNTVKPRSNKIETLKPNITPKARPPSKVTEINLNKKNEEGKGMVKKDSDRGSEDGTRKRDQPNGTFYKKFEKYKTPFSDPEYEDKPMKINSDLESNPNLKKLDSSNKTLVLQEFSKSSENVEGWLRDETDKMATLLLKVLQDAADGNSRRRVAGKPSGKGNPYEAIRKKQENNSSTAKGKKKESGKKRMVPALAKKIDNDESGAIREGKNVAEERSKKGQFPIIEDDSHVVVLTPDSHLPKEPFQVQNAPIAISNESLTDDIPGPYLLKKISSLWRYLPDLGCQTTVFLLVRMFHLAKIGLSVFSPEAKKSRRNPFDRLFMKYGPVVNLQGPLSGDVILINRPEDMNSVFNQLKAYPARSVLDPVENCRVRFRKKNFPLGITRSCNGIEWDVVRKSMIDVGNKGCLQYFNMLKNTDTLFVNKIQAIRNNQKQVPDDFITEVKKWSMEGLCGVLFDKSLGFLEKKSTQIHWISESERLMRHLGEATDHLCQCEGSFQTWRFINTPALRGLNQAYQSLDLIISKYVYQAELTLRKKKKALTNNKSNSNKNLNFLESMLLNDKMAPDEITANLIDILLIGANTTTVALAFLLYNLALNNRVQCLLYKEIKELLPTKTSTLNYHQLHSLKYLQACLKESMRLNVPIPLLLRVLPSDIVLANYRIPYGTHIIMDTQTACMKEQVFDDPDRFKPERWLEQDNVHPFASFPFSNGPRASFIKRLTEIQLWTCIAQIVRNYQIEYHFGEIRSSKGVISYPDKPLRLTFIERME